MESIDPNTLATKNEDAAPPVVDEDTHRLIAETEAMLAALKSKLAPKPDAAEIIETATVTDAPEPPVKAPPAPIVPAGKPMECDPVAAKPGEIVQVITQLPPGSVLRGLKVTDGLRVSAVMVGRQVFPVAGSAGSWEECLGKVVPPQSFLILLVENTTKDHLIARATWFVTSDGGTVQAQAPAYQAPAPQATPAAPLYHDGASQGFGLNTPAATQAIPVSRSVTPGTNEVCILIQRGECERLLASLSGGQFISDHEKPSIVRQIASALKR